MKLSRTAAEVLENHVELECIDRMYSNVYVPDLQRDLGVVSFFRYHRGLPFASGALMAPMTEAFVAKIKAFAEKHSIPVVIFEKGQRKDDIAKEYRDKFSGEEGVYLLGKAQEKARVWRTESRRNPETGARYPWLVWSTAMVTQYYFYAVDRDFGPFFLKFPEACRHGHRPRERGPLPRGDKRSPRGATPFAGSRSAVLEEPRPATQGGERRGLVERGRRDGVRGRGKPAERTRLHDGVRSHRTGRNRPSPKPGLFDLRAAARERQAELRSR